MKIYISSNFLSFFGNFSGIYMFPKVNITIEKTPIIPLMIVFPGVYSKVLL